MEPEGSLPCLQKPATGPCPEPAVSSSPHRLHSPLRRKMIELLKAMNLYGRETVSL
jgi:hypothetical protein